MHFSIIASPRAQHQIAHQEALAQGLKVHGIRASLTNHYRVKTKYVACWGWRQGKLLRNLGHEVLVMERGYLGDRFTWSSLAWNGLNGFGQFAEAPDDSGERFNSNFVMLPWKTGGDYILVMGQVPGDASLRRQDLMPWYQNVCAKAAEHYGLPVHFRAHPEAIRKGFKQRVSGAIISRSPLAQALEGAALVITYNSNSAVDAVLAGVPTIAWDGGSMAWDVTGHDIHERIQPDRSKWAANLAWKQWRLSEIESGFAVSHLLSVPHG